MTDKDFIFKVIIGLVTSPITALIMALALQGFIKIACGFVPKYWQAYRASLAAYLSILLISFGIAFIATLVFNMDFRLVSALCFLAGYYTQSEIYGRMIKKGSVSIGLKNAMLIVVVQFLALGMLVTAVLIFPAPTIKGRAILAIVGLTCFSIVYAIATRKSNKDQQQASPRTTTNRTAHETVSLRPHIKNIPRTIHETQVKDINNRTPQSPSQSVFNSNSVQCIESAAQPALSTETKTENVEISDEKSDEFYVKALDEYESGNFIKSLYSRAIAEGDGNPAKERSRYVNLRTVRLQAEFLADQKKVKEEELKHSEKVLTVGERSLEINTKKTLITTYPQGFNINVDGKNIDGITGEIPLEINNKYKKFEVEYYYIDSFLLKSTYDNETDGYEIHQNLEKESLQLKDFQYMTGLKSDHIAIKTEPSGCNIIINGERVKGETPLEILYSGDTCDIDFICNEKIIATKKYILSPNKRLIEEIFKSETPTQ